jgi:hypothetical protein
MNRSWVRFRPHIIGIILLTLATKYIPWVLGPDDGCWHFSAVPTVPSDVQFQGKAAVPQKS